MGVKGTKPRPNIHPWMLDKCPRRTAPVCAMPPPSLNADLNFTDNPQQHWKTFSLFLNTSEECIFDVWLPDSYFPLIISNLKVWLGLWLNKSSLQSKILWQLWHITIALHRAPSLARDSVSIPTHYLCQDCLEWQCGTADMITHKGALVLMSEELDPWYLHYAVRTANYLHSVITRDQVARKNIPEFQIPTLLVCNDVLKGKYLFEFHTSTLQQFSHQHLQSRDQDKLRKRRLLQKFLSQWNPL